MRSLERCERDGVQIVVDVGHNPQAARQLAAWLAASPVAGCTHAVFAALRDKDARGVVDVLAAVIDDWHLAGLAEHGPRGMDGQEFAGQLVGSAAGGGNVHVDVAQALRSAREAARPGDRIVVFGSFHTVASALEHLGGP